MSPVFPPRCETVPSPASSLDNPVSSVVPNEALKVLTYNVQFRPTVADIMSPGWPNTKERALAIGRAIVQYDLVALQEVFRQDRLEEIWQAAEATGTAKGIPSRLPSGRQFDVVIGPSPRRLSPAHPSFFELTFREVARGVYDLFDFVRDDDRKAKPMENSGLVLLSRYPIVCVDRLAYHAKAEADAWAQKGALHVLIQRSPSSSAVGSPGTELEFAL